MHTSKSAIKSRRLKKYRLGIRVLKTDIFRHVGYNHLCKFVSHEVQGLNASHPRLLNHCIAS